MRLVTIAIGMFACMMYASTVVAQDNAPLSKFMHQKLVLAQNVLEALATEDYKAIAKGGQEMSLLSRAAGWQVMQTREYRRYSMEFRQAADDLTKAGDQKKLDAAALSYVQITLTCVNCHKHVRASKLARLDLDLRR